MLGEFLSANVSAPFLLFMVEGALLPYFVLLHSIERHVGFGGFQDEADVGYWTGILGMLFRLRSVR